MVKGTSVAVKVVAETVLLKMATVVVLKMVLMTVVPVKV